MKNLKKILAAAVLGACAAYAIFLALAFCLADKIIFPAPKPSYASLPNLEMVDAGGGRKIAAVFLPAENSKLCVIYSHGNREDLKKIMPLIEDYRRRLGANVIAYDYFGYGISGGKMAQADLPKCADAVYELALKKGFEPSNMLFAGYSLGSVPAAYLAAKHPEAKGAVLIGGISRGIKTFLPIDIVPWKILHNVDNVAAAKIPILLMHGTRDKKVHMRAALENLAAAKNARLVEFQGFGHGGLFEEELYWSELSKFIKDKK